MTIRPSWHAVRRRGFLASALPWRATAYLLSGVPIGAATLMMLILLTVTGTVAAALLVGIPLLMAFGLAGIPVAAVERYRLRLLDGERAPNPHQVPDQPGLTAWLRTRYQEQVTWRELAYGALLALVLWPLDLMAVVFLLAVPGSLLLAPVLRATAPGGEVKLLKTVLVTSGWQAGLAVIAGIVILALAAYVITFWAFARATITRFLLDARGRGPGEDVTELVRSRARLVDAFEAERRRIERDLHDGAQQQLVALGVTLGLAKLAPAGEARGLIAKAHEQARAALTGLRELIQGIHPRVLSDRGLPAAIDELADRSPVPTETKISVPRRLPAAIEATAYFVVCEAMANVVKHSRAHRATVTGGLRDDRRLVLSVSDDGVGGADPARGSGLTGLADRLAVVGGNLTLSSPPQGPTVLRLEIPCA